jgi:hypothetical protein
MRNYNKFEMVTDIMEIKRVTKWMARENKVDIENISIHPKFKYIETIDHCKKDLDFCSTEYDKHEYAVQYFSGCFNPYLVKRKLN